MQVEIIDISYDGCGVGRVDGKVVFVPRTDIGEIVDVQIVKENSKFSTGKVVKVLKKSKSRCESNCPYFDECGGCDFQFLDYDREIELKTKILENELKKVNFFEKIDVFPAKSRFNYRNKIKLTYVDDKLGYLKSQSKKVVDIDFCPLAESEINDAIMVIKKYLKKYKYQNLKSVTFRKSDESVLISFLFSQKEKFFYDEILGDFVVGVFVGDVLESNKTVLTSIFHQKECHKTILCKKIPVDFASFFQVNDEVASCLYQTIIKNVAGKKVVNAYSGQGALSLLLAEKATKVVGIEVQKSSHLIAEKLKTSNMKNINGLVEKELSKLLKNENYDIIVLDPARAGCEKSGIDAIKNAQIKEIFYISCNFSTLIRDLKLLCEKYKIKSVQVFDMFPSTANLEVLVSLEKII